MAAALRAHLPPSVSLAAPSGGFFFWLNLGRDSRAVFERAVEEGVAFLPGPAFYPEPGETVGDVAEGAGRARLCFTFAQPEEIVEGARRLSRALGQA